MLSTMAPKKATQKPEMEKPGTRWEASCNMSALITNQKRPRVSNVSGKVKSLENKPEGCVDQTDYDSGDERCSESLHLDSRNDVSDDQQTNGADEPVEQQGTHGCFS